MCVRAIDAGQAGLFWTAHGKGFTSSHSAAFLASSASASLFSFSKAVQSWPHSEQHSTDKPRLVWAGLQSHIHGLVMVFFHHCIRSHL